MVRLQRRDALAYLNSADPRGLRIPLPRRQTATTVLASLLLVPALLLPNGMNDILNLREQQRAAAENQAQRLTETADRLNEGRTAPDPRVDIAQELRDLAQQLRDHPEDLNANLAKLGSLEDALRSRIDPANEQRAAAITSLSRQLSRSATGSDSNPSGDPQKTSQDLKDLANRLPQMTDQQRQDLARELSQQDATARQAGGDAQSALADAVRAIQSGDQQAASDALNRLGDSLTRGQQQVDVNRDIARAASDLQQARRDLANAGQQGQQGQGQGQQPGHSPGQGQGQGQQPGQSPGQGQGQQPGQSPGQGQGQGQGQGSLGGGGSNARYLGSGNGGNSGFRSPTSGNRQFGTGDLDGVYADFGRLGKPGDPSYIPGVGGDGQIQQGQGQGHGTDNQSEVPYTNVFQDFYDFAITSLDRSYVPIDVKDYVRDYFSSLNPSAGQ
jgi:hypothetical protein